MGHERLVNSKQELLQMASMLCMRIAEKLTEAASLEQELHRVEARILAEFASK